MSVLSFEDFTTREGCPNSRVIRDNKKISLHSIQPYAEAERIIQHFNPDLKWIVIAGCGLGYIIETLLKKTAYHIIAFEHDRSILEHSFELRKNQDLYQSKRIHLFHDPDIMLEYMDENNVKELSFYIHRPYLTLFPDLYQNLEGILISYLSKKQINKATLRRFQYVWLRNLIKNSALFFHLPGLSDLRHDFQNKPAIVVGAGPSLQSDLPALLKHQDRACIIATDTAYPILCASGIKADFVVSVDPQNKNTQFLLYAQEKDTCLILDATGSFISFSKSTMRDIVFYDSFFPVYENLSPFWGKKGQLLSGGSVSTNAFDLATQLQCSPVILAGQDLAFTDSHTHSRGNVLEDFLYFQTDRLESYEKYNTKLLVLSDRIQVNSNNGKTVSTDRKFLTYLEWFKKQIRSNETPVYNTSKNGAFIKGAQYCDLNDIMEAYPLISPKTISFEKQKTDPSAFNQYLLELSRSLDELIPYARRACQAARQCHSRPHNNLKSQYEEMSRFDRKLLDSMKTGVRTAHFLELCMQSSIEKMSELSEIREINEALIQGWTELYDDAYRGLCYIRRLVQKRFHLDHLRTDITSTGRGNSDKG